MKRLMKLLFVEFEFEFELMTGHVGQPNPSVELPHN